MRKVINYQAQMAAFNGNLNKRQAPINLFTDYPVTLTCKRQKTG